MGAVRQFVFRLLHTLRPHRASADVSREIASHLALLEDDYRRRGMTPSEARRRARLALGGIETVRHEHRDARAFRWLNELATELRQAKRALTRHWRLSLAAIVILAAVGTLNAVVLGIADTVLFRPLPYANPSHLYVVMMSRLKSGERATLVPNSLLALLREPTAEISAAGIVETGPRITVTTSDGPSGVLAMAATPSYFDVLGVRAFRGRLFVPADADRPEQVAVLSYACWKERFGGQDDIVGRTVTLGDRMLDVVGVLPPGLFFPVVFNYVPEVFTAAPFPRATEPGGAFFPVVRIGSGVTRDQAQATLMALAAAGVPELGARGEGPVLDPVDSRLFPNGRPIMRLLTTAAAALLILACVNLATLMLVRSRSRSREVGVRLALGASRARIVRPIVFEIAMLSVVSGVLSVTLAAWMFEPLLRLVPRVAYGNAPVGIDVRVAVITIGAGLLATVLFSFVPAWRSAREDPRALMANDAVRVSASMWRFGRPLLSLQVALALVLVFGAAVTGRAFVSLLQIPLGFDPTSVVEISIRTPRATDESLTGRVLEALRARPEVLSAGAVGNRPFDGAAPDIGLQNGTGKRVGGVLTAPGYLETVGIQIIRGRSLGAPGDSDAAVLSRSGARTLFGNEDSLGKTLTDGRGHTFRVVGVAADVRYGLDRPEDEAPAVAYVIQPSQRPMAILARVRAQDNGLLDDLRNTVRLVVPGARVGTTWWRDTIAGVTAYRNPRFQTTVLGALGAIGLLLTTVGITGVVGFLVASRRRELGIRAVLGATPVSLVALVIRQVLGPVMIGLATGLVATHWAGRLAEAQLFKVQASDPWTLALTTAVIVAAAVIAAWLPARMAGRVDPAAVLHAD